jgi:hypothetical protein
MRLGVTLPQNGTPMKRRMLAMSAALALVAGCASTNPPDQWSAKYHKAGGFGGLAPRLGDSRLVDVDPFSECVKAKGYTVTQ